MIDDALQVALGGIVAFAEAIVGVGIILPGEVAVVGISAALEPSGRVLLFPAVALGATLGDHLNYWLGRTLGGRLERSRLVRRIGIEHWDRSVTLIKRYGASAVIISRMLPVIRTLMAAVAGSAKLDYLRFSAASLAGSALWAALWILAGDAVRGILDTSLLALPVIAVTALVVWWKLGRLRARTKGSPS